MVDHLNGVATVVVTVTQLSQGGDSSGFPGMYGWPGLLGGLSGRPDDTKPKVDWVDRVVLDSVLQPILGTWHKFFFGNVRYLEDFFCAKEIFVLTWSPWK